MVRYRCNGVIPVLVTGIHFTACSGARGWLDAGDKPRHDNVALDQIEQPDIPGENS